MKVAPTHPVHLHVHQLLLLSDYSKLQRDAYSETQRLRSIGGDITLFITGGEECRWLRASGRWARNGLGGGWCIPIIGSACGDQQAKFWDVAGGLGTRECLYCTL